jgi:hypothetical protein
LMGPQPVTMAGCARVRSQVHAIAAELIDKSAPDCRRGIIRGYW